MIFVKCTTMAKLCLLFLMIGICRIGASDYFYWREYTGEVPSDALPGGKDEDGRDTYIGQGYIHGHGLYVAQIIPGIKEVDVPCYGVKTAQMNIKILCTDTPEYFSWVKTSAKTFEDDTANLTVVVGAYDHVGNNGIMHIGRIFYQGNVIVGDVTPFKSRRRNVQLWYPYKKVERAANFYEVLIYHVFEIDPRISKTKFANVTLLG